jgi:hypothetical protein
VTSCLCLSVSVSVSVCISPQISEAYEISEGLAFYANPPPHIIFVMGLTRSLLSLSLSFSLRLCSIIRN